jgi:hypothetical protein
LIEMLLMEAVRCDPLLQPFSQRLRATIKPAKVAPVRRDA